MTKLTGKVFAKGSTFSATDDSEITIGTKPPSTETPSGITTHGGTGPAYVYSANYIDDIVNSWGNTPNEYVDPWAGALPSDAVVLNNGHTRNFSRGWATTCYTAANLTPAFAISGANISSFSTYLEFVVDHVIVSKGLPIMQVGIEWYPVYERAYGPTNPQPYIPRYQIYYTTDGSVVVYDNGSLATSYPAGSNETWGATDVIGIVFTYGGTGWLTVEFWKNGVFQSTFVEVEAEPIEYRGVFNAGQRCVGYMYGPQPYVPPTPPTPAMITLSSHSAPTYTGNNYVYENDYIIVADNMALMNGYTSVSTEFATGTTATYLNSNQSVAYPPAVAPWPHVTELSSQTQVAGHSFIYEVQNTAGTTPTTMLSKVGITAPGVDEFYTADAGGGNGYYNVGDVVGVIVSNSDANDETVITFFVNGIQQHMVTLAPISTCQIYVEFSENIFRPIGV